MADVALLAELERLGFADVMLWVISFALVYGLMSQAGIPKDRAPRAIIGFVVAFLVLMASPAALITTISNLGTSLLVTLLGVMMLLVFIEAGGVKHYEEEKKYDEKGKYIGSIHHEKRLFHKTPYVTAIVLILAAIVIFLGAGGLNVANIQLPIDPLGAAFLAMIAIAIVWLVSEKKEGE
jgi:hypothetical protein